MDSDDPIPVSYQGGNVEAVKETRTGDDAHHTSSPISSSFTPINYHPTQLPTPRSSIAPPVLQNQAQRRATASSRRQRNPTVAQYLGLDNANQPAHLDRYAPPSAEPKTPPPKLLRKRVNVVDEKHASSHKRTNAARRDVPTQTQLSDSFRIAKSIHKSAAAQSKQATYKASQPMMECTASPQTTLSSGTTSDKSQLGQSHNANQTDAVIYPTPKSGFVHGQETETASVLIDHVGLRVLDPENDHFDTNFLAEFDEYLPQEGVETQIPDDEDLDDDISDSDLLMLTPAANSHVSGSVDSACNSPFQPSISSGPHRHDAEAGSSVHTAIDLDQDLHGLNARSAKKFTSPVTLTTRLLAATGDLNSLKARKAIVRPPFPIPVRDRSPVIGLSSSTMLKTCFRIGEAINQSCQASKSGKRVIIELYARVLDSERTEVKHYFTFCDLFHAKPPHLKATYDATIWKQVQLFEYDGRRLLEQGRICRCIGTMKREDKEWTMTILNIWEATWEDVNWVEGIVGV